MDESPHSTSLHSFALFCRCWLQFIWHNFYGFRLWRVGIFAWTETFMFRQKHFGFCYGQLSAKGLTHIWAREREILEKVQFLARSSMCECVYTVCVCVVCRVCCVQQEPICGSQNGQRATDHQMPLDGPWLVVLGIEIKKGAISI